MNFSENGTTSAVHGALCCVLWDGPESLRGSRDLCPVSAGGHCGCFPGVRFKGRELKAWLLLRKARKNQDFLGGAVKN